ncbi:MAG: hypothetical protein EVB11_11240 [Winogradskyella sp.]|nr:MAG: hypothetical protein EVB11_11240 [Winogradskyella sp.]
MIQLNLMIKNIFLQRFAEGGVFMYFILVCLLLSIFFIVRAFLSKRSNKVTSKKMIGLAANASLLGLVLGCLGSVIGIITLFDMLEAIGEARPDLVAAGIKLSLMTITFGLLNFVIARVGILVYKWSLQSEEVES